MPTVTDFPAPPVPAGVCRFIVVLMALASLSACAPSNQADEELRKEIQALKTQVAVLQEKLNQVQTGQQAILDLLKQPAHAAAPIAPMAVPSQPAAPDALTVDQLLASKDRYLGTRVKVKGMPGPVMVHHKSLMLKGPQGLVEVLFGNLPDPKLIQSLTSAALDKPLTVTGVVNLPPARGAGAQLQINAEAVEF
ncbi:MAG TPA: hypothetical protein VJA64_11040 [Desulfobaccales bacterium]|nr:hypothetical protein [Desulfobaccales bacterium]